MQLVFNELSCLPLAPDSATAEYRFRNFANCFKAIAKEYPFKHVLFSKAYRDMQVTTEQTFFEWISSINNRDFTGLILGLCITPYADDLEAEEIGDFFDGTYSIPDEECPTKDEPFGLPIAHIKTSPSISLDSNAFWRKNLITVRKSSETGDIDFDVVNLCLPDDFKTEVFQQWYSKHLGKDLSTEDKLIAFLAYKKFKVVFQHGFFDQFLEWKETAPRVYDHLLALLKDVELHPFVGGLGKTEPLKYRNNEASKRITHGDRLSYTVDNDTVTFLACKGHYES